MNATGYKWMLFGNASTVFFPEAAMQLLEDFDPGLPYIITDDLVWQNASGAARPEEAPRCLPCHFDDAHELLRLSQGKDFPPHLAGQALFSSTVTTALAFVLYGLQRAGILMGYRKRHVQSSCSNSMTQGFEVESRREECAAHTLGYILSQELHSHSPVQVPWRLKEEILIQPHGIWACPRAAHAPQSCCARLGRTSLAACTIAAAQTFRSSKPTP